MKILDANGKGSFLTLEVGEKCDCYLLRKVKNKKGFTLWVLSPYNEILKIPAQEIKRHPNAQKDAFLTVLSTGEYYFDISASDKKSPIPAHRVKKKRKQVSDIITQGKRDAYEKKKKSNNIKKEKDANKIGKGNFKIFLSGKVQEDFFWK